MAGYGAPAVDFYSMLSGLGDTIQANGALKARQDLINRRSQAFSTLSALDPNSPDYGKQAVQIAQSLGTGGDMEGAKAFLDRAESAAARQRQAEMDARSERHWQASYDLQKRAAARADEPKYFIKETTDQNGNTTLVRVRQDGPEGPIGGQPTPQAGNPFGSGKFNSDQAKAAGFTDRMLQSEGILSGRVGPDGQPVKGFEGNDTQGGRWGAYAIENAPWYVPDAVKNSMQDPTYRSYAQAKRDFINAQLRRESGAAISPSEFDSANKQYFPMPGDDEATIKQKRANRRAAVEAMGREGGQSYRPRYTFTSEGKITDYKPDAGRPRAVNDKGQVIEWNGAMWVPVRAQ